MFRDIPGFEGIYQISEAGIVINIQTGKIIKPSLSSSGYYYIRLKKDGNSKQYLLHRVLAQTFIPNPNNYPIVLHGNNIKTDIDLNNLSWGTIKQNNIQAIRDKLLGVPKSGVMKDYIITSCDPNYYVPICYHGMTNLALALDCSKKNGHKIVGFHKQIKKGPFIGYYAEKVN